MKIVLHQEGLVIGDMELEFHRQINFSPQKVQLLDCSVQSCGFKVLLASVFSRCVNHERVVGWMKRKSIPLDRTKHHCSAHLGVGAQESGVYQTNCADCRMAVWIGQAVQEGPGSCKISRSWFCVSCTSSTVRLESKRRREEGRQN